MVERDSKEVIPLEELDVLEGDGVFSWLHGAGDGRDLGVPLYVPYRIGLCRKLRRDGWTREEIVERDPENFRIWQASGEDFRYPEGESRRDFHNRVADALCSLLAQAPPARGLFVVHRGVIAVILTELLRLSATERAALAIDLGSIHLLCETASGWRAEALNRVEHLEKGVIE